MERVLIIGGGGREHALGWKLAQSKNVEQLFFAPGNGGTADVGTNLSINLTSHDEIIAAVHQYDVSFVVVAPDDFLADGVVDSLIEAKIPAFGPTRAASKIEWSKAYAKEVMESAGIPTAKHQSFLNFDEAKTYITGHPLPVVIKASGLALGKGVVIAEDTTVALETLDSFMRGGVHGEAGKEVVIEEFLEGVEFSTHAFVDKSTVSMFPPSQDHKRVFDNDEGPNTGGMGTVVPLPWVSEADLEQVQKTIFEPLLEELKNRGVTYRGLLYPGLMMTKDGPKVVEFNARFGDPETQSYMRLLESDLFEIMKACVSDSLSQVDVSWSKESAACVVMASGGYPGSYEKGKTISGIDSGEEDEAVVVFHAGTKAENNTILTNGGRVLNVTATGTDLQEALKRAYEGVQKISFDGAQYRTDIGKKSL